MGLSLLLALGCRPSETPPQERPPVNPEPAPVQAAPEPPPPLPPHAILDDGIRAAREAAQRRVLAPDSDLLPDLSPLPDGELPGLALPADPMPGFFVPMSWVDDARPLAHFESALAELESGERKEPVRLAFYGASGTAADLWTGYVRSYLQTRFGDGGPGMTWAAKPNRWSRHNELQLASSKHWTKHNSYRLEDEQALGYFGVMGQAMSATSKRAWSELRPGKRSESAKRIASYDLFHLQQPEGGHYIVKIDGEQVAELDTALPDGESAPRLGRHHIDVEPGAHTLRIELEGDGEVRLLGVAAETGEPGIVLDTLGVNGAKSANQLRWHEDLWAEHLKLRAPALYVLAFGNNESVDEDDPISQYEADYRTVLDRFRRTLPEASCVILGPGDFPKVEEGEILPRPRLMEIRQVQMRLAPEYGCAFYDAISFAGGPGAKRAWVEAGLARDDYLHLTRAGYVRFGLGFADSLMQHYDARVRTTALGSD